MTRWNEYVHFGNIAPAVRKAIARDAGISPRARTVR